MNFLGMTLNVLTLMALSLAIGLLIDDAIVVRENIVRHLEHGQDHFEAARQGTSEIGLAVLATNGRVSVATSKGMATRAGDVMVAPTSSNWTEFDVTDVDGRVQVVARKGDVSISDGGQSTTLPQGQEATRDESNDRKKEKRRQGAAAPAGAGGWLDSPWAIGIGAGAVGGVVLWVLLEDQQPFSPAKP